MESGCCVGGAGGLVTLGSHQPSLLHPDSLKGPFPGRGAHTLRSLPLPTPGMSSMLSGGKQPANLGSLSEPLRHPEGNAIEILFWTKGIPSLFQCFKGKGKRKAHCAQ